MIKQEGEEGEEEEERIVIELLIYLVYLPPYQTFSSSQPSLSPYAIALLSTSDMEPKLHCPPLPLVLQILELVLFADVFMGSNASPRDLTEGDKHNLKPCYVAVSHCCE